MNMHKRYSLPKLSMMKAVSLLYDTVPVRSVDNEFFPTQTGDEYMNSIAQLSSDHLNISPAPESLPSKSLSHRRLTNLISTQRSSQPAISSSVSTSTLLSETLLAKKNFTGITQNSLNEHQQQQRAKHPLKTITSFETIYQTQQEQQQQQQQRQPYLSSNTSLHQPNSHHSIDVDRLSHNHTQVQQQRTQHSQSNFSQQSSKQISSIEKMKRLGMGEWKVSKFTIGEEEWNNRIIELKASIKKKMPAFSSKLLKSYEGYSIEPDLRLAHRNVQAHPSLHSTARKLPSYHSYIESKTQSKESTSSDIKSKKLAVIEKRIAAHEAKTQDEPIIPKDLLETSKRMSECAFFRISNLKAEKSTHKIIVPTTESGFSTEHHKTDIEQQLMLTNKQIKQRSNTYKTFKTAARNYYAYHPSEI